MNSFLSFDDFQNKAKGLPYNSTSKVIYKPNLTTNFPRPEIQDEFLKAKKQNGLIEKITDKIKNTFHFGSNSKKIEELINQNKSDEEVKKEIKKYRQSQESAAQAVADIASGTASILAFSEIKTRLQILVAKYYHMGTFDFIKDKKLKDSLGKNAKKIDLIENIIKNKKSPIIAAAIGAMLVGGFVKLTVLKLNRFGTKQYKFEKDKNLSKKENKINKKRVQKQKNNANFRNFVSGMINGLATPFIVLGGAIGAPLYIVANSLNRYFIGTREDRGEKSFKSYVENLKNSKISNALAAVALAVPAFIKGNYNKVFDKNINEVVEELKKAKLQKPTVVKSSYEQLEDIIFSKQEVADIFDGKIKGISPEDFARLDEKEKLKLQIQALGDENIFAVKFKQITNGSTMFGYHADELSAALKEKCPATYTLEEASEKINKAFNNEYKVISSYGAGTVAETYLVEDKTGKQFCIKMLKKGITLDKIARDEKTIIDYIQNLQGKTQDEKDFLIKNFKNIAQSVKEEVDLSNEMKSAQELAKVTKNARIVKPVKLSADNSLYVMEKADGVSLQSLIDYVQNSKYAKWGIDFYSERLKEAQEAGSKWGIDYYSERLKEAQESLQQYGNLTKEIGEISKDDAKTLLERYQDVLVEQFNQIGKDGKIIHGDIHPGNIYIDMKALKDGRKDFFTLIDTGNTIQQSSKQAMRFMNLSKYIQNADYENIADFALEGAKLPEGLTQDKAREALVNGLKKTFFDYETFTGPVSNSTILGITDGIMQKLNIIPGGTQAGLIKSKTSADRSMDKFQHTFMQGLAEKFEKKMEKIGIEDEKDLLNPVKLAKVTKEAGAMGIEMQATLKKYPRKQAKQEKINLALLSPTEKAKMKKSKSAPSKNSKEFLTYIIKQNKKLPTVNDILGNISEMKPSELVQKLKSISDKDLELLKQADTKGVFIRTKEAIDEFTKQGINIEEQTDFLDGLDKALKSYSVTSSFNFF